MATSNYSVNNSYNDLKLFSDTTRHTFLGIFVVITTFSLVGNCAVIYTITKKNYRMFQKTCIISLALSDIMGTVAIAIINMFTFAQEVKIWPIGGFWCKFLPMCQMTGILASSDALMFIAMDRYRNVVYAMSKRWNPGFWLCLVVTAASWTASFGVSYPMYEYYKLVFYPTKEELLPLCILEAEKNTLMDYYIIMVVIIFLPLFTAFLWCYYNIAALVWKHRKPLSTIFKNSTSNQEVKKSQDEIRVERKIRTFKIIVTLMVVFILCRLPYFAIQILKCLSSKITNTKEVWYMSFAFMGLHIVNCALNPLLYTFLNSTLHAWGKIRRFFWEICCVFCSTDEFETFDKVNPFNIEGYDKQNQKVDDENSGKRNVSKVRFKF